MAVMLLFSGAKICFCNYSTQKYYCWCS